MAGDKIANFLILDIGWVFHEDTLEIQCKTDAERILWCEVATARPYDYSFIHYKRGTPQRHDVRFAWPTGKAYAQETYALSFLHTFIIPDLVECTDIWLRFRGWDGRRWAASSTPVWTTHVLFTAPPPGPQPTVGVLEIPVATTRLRPGNRYAHWINNTWYVIINEEDCINVWKLVDGSFVRQDFPHYPVPLYGIFKDIDTRIRHTTNHIAIVSKCHDPATGQVALFYHSFDTDTDTWLHDEQIVAVPNSAWASQTASLDVDQMGVMHVVYDRWTGTHPTIWYIQGLPGVWAGNLEVISPLFRDETRTTAWLDQTTQDFHVACNAGNRNYWNRRTVGGVWYGETQIPRSVYAGQSPSAMTQPGHPHLAFQNPSFDVTHAWGTPPTTWEDKALTGNTYYHSMLVNPEDPYQRAIVYRSSTSRPFIIIKQGGDPWGDELIIADTSINVIASNHHANAIISTVWTLSAGGWVRFAAFYPPYD